MYVVNIDRKHKCMPKRRRYHHGDLRASLIEAVFVRLASGPPEGLTLRGIAADVGVSPMAAYRHFADLDGLLAAVATAGFEKLGAHLGAASAKLPAGARRVEALGMAYLQFAENSPGLYRLMFSRHLSAFKSDEGLARAAAAAYAILLDTVRDALPPLRAAEAEEMATVLWVSVHGTADLTMSQLLPAGADPSATVGERIVARVARLID